MYVIFFTFSYLHGCVIVDSPSILHYDIEDKLPPRLEWECGIETLNDDMVWNGDSLPCLPILESEKSVAGRS